MTPTDKPMTVDALIENTRLAWYLGQRYWQQADSESYAENRRSDLTLEKFNKLLESGRAAIEQYGREQREAVQAKLDRVMLEYCPEEMTPEQIAEWAKHQVAAPGFDETALDAALAAGRGSGEPIAMLHDDGHWTHPPGRDPLDRFSGKVRMEVYAAPQPPREPLTDEQMARKFHETYERLAPAFGYETRPDTKAFDPESPNGRLMIAVIHNIRSEL